MKTPHGLVILDYEGPDPRIPNVHAFGFMQTEDVDRGVNDFDRPVLGYEAAQELAHQHWQKHLTFRIVNKKPYEVQHVFAYEPGVLIENLFRWDIDLFKFDPTLPKEAK